MQSPFGRLMRGARASGSRHPRGRVRAAPFVLLLIWSASALFVGARLTRGWVPHDEGTLAQSAERVLDGQLPHRDYDEVYTGGLAFLDAAAFRLLGENLVAPRILLYLLFLAWVPAVFYVATSFVPLLSAGALTLLCVVWSLPNYPAAIPSWFNLFFGVFGVAALLRYLEVERARWLFLAGVAGGISCLAKVVGLYYVAGGLLFLTYHEQLSHDRQPIRARAPSTYSLVLYVALAAFLASVVSIVSERPSPSVIATFVLPPAALAVALLETELGLACEPARPRVANLASLAGPFLLGVVLPIAIYFIPFVRVGALAPLLHGLFVAPAQRFYFASTDFPPLRTAVSVVPLAALLWLDPGALDQRPRRRLVFTAVVGIALTLLFLKAWHPLPYRVIWTSLRWLAPLVVCGGALLLGTREARATLTRTERERVFLLLAVTGTFLLVQFPFSAPVYFLYAAPLVFLSSAALLSARRRAPGSMAALLTGFYMAFALRYVLPGFIYDMGIYYSSAHFTASLELPRGGLSVTDADADQYRRLAALVRAHARGPYAFATPDCPEVYFLAGVRNPTRTLFDFFDPPVGRTQRVIRTLERARVNVVVINSVPSFSGPVPANMLAAIKTRYPYAAVVGQFQVRWRQ